MSLEPTPHEDQFMSDMCTMNTVINSPKLRKEVGITLCKWTWTATQWSYALGTCQTKYEILLSTLNASNSIYMKYIKNNIEYIVHVIPLAWTPKHLKTPDIDLGPVHMGSKVPLMLASPNTETKVPIFEAQEIIKIWLIIIEVGFW